MRKLQQKLQQMISRLKTRLKDGYNDQDKITDDKYKNIRRIVLISISFILFIIILQQFNLTGSSVSVFNYTNSDIKELTDTSIVFTDATVINNDLIKKELQNVIVLAILVVVLTTGMMYIDYRKKGHIISDKLMQLDDRTIFAKFWSEFRFGFTVIGLGILCVAWISLSTANIDNIIIQQEIVQTSCDCEVYDNFPKEDPFKIGYRDEIGEILRVNGLSHLSLNDFQAYNYLWTILKNSDKFNHDFPKSATALERFKSVRSYYNKYVCGLHKNCEDYMAKVAPRSNVLVFVKFLVYYEAEENGLESVYFDPSTKALKDEKFNITAKVVKRWVKSNDPNRIMDYGVKLYPDIIINEMQLQDPQKEINLVEEYVAIMDSAMFNPSFSPGLMGEAKDVDKLFKIPVPTRLIDISMLKRNYSSQLPPPPPTSTN